MAKSTPRYWFSSKKFGFGWTPVTLEGWVATLSYVFIAVYAFIEVHKDFPLPKQNIIAAAPTFCFATLIFLLICYKTGEPLKWRWGK
jgi:hypothetical protein